MAAVAKPVYELLRNDSKFERTERCNKAFEFIKKMIKDREALALFDTASSNE